MTHDEIVEKAWSEMLSFVDGETMRSNIDLAESAQIYRELASECRDRAVGLDEEADAMAKAEEENEAGEDAP